MSCKLGALPSQLIREMIDAGHVRGGDPCNISPASLDLVLGRELFRTTGSFLPFPNESVSSILPLVDATPMHEEAILEVGVTYCGKLAESFALPESVYACCNPKSSTGRSDVLVRVVADGTSRYDAMPKGYHGELWVLIRPQSFPVRVSPGLSLSQARFFNADTRLSETEMEVLFDKDKLLFHNHGTPISYDEMAIKDRDGSLILTAAVKGDCIGWECIAPQQVFDFGAPRNHYLPSSFFRVLRAENGGALRLKEGRFYILWTTERVRVPPHLACEMVPMDERSGEFRSHYAGYIDPGWGWGVSGEGIGRRLVLEVRPYEDLSIRDGQPIAKVRFERMASIPDMLYDSREGSHYQEDVRLPRLSKQFSVSG